MLWAIFECYPLRYELFSGKDTETADLCATSAEIDGRAEINCFGILSFKAVLGCGWNLPLMHSQ